jgi:sulfur-oxidizing protein SoxA
VNFPRLLTLAVCLLACLQTVAETRSFASRTDLPTDQVRSGVTFLRPETRATQADNFANPGYLWVERGRELFNASSAAGPGCADCHAAEGDRPLRGAATRYPQYDPDVGTLLNLEARINQCRVRYQSLPALDYESEPLLALTAWVANQSHGLPIKVSIEGEAERFYEAGRQYFFRRRGQLNLACNQCHDDNWGRMLRGDRISQGHPNAWPGYRLEWQTFGSLHRRLADCDIGVRAEPHAGGSHVYTALELYLAWRTRGLTLESPGIRR